MDRLSRVTSPRRRSGTGMNVVAASRPGAPSVPSSLAGESGFSLLEALVAMIVLVVGLLGLAQVFVLGMLHMRGSSSNLIAREKAREAIESIHAARDSGTIDWEDVTNATAADDCPAGTTTTTSGEVLSGWLTLRQAGPDNLVNTADDQTAPPERAPGQNNVMGDTDDVLLNGFQRKISICQDPTNFRLRLLVVSIRYPLGTTQQVYTVTTYLSSFS